MTFEEVLKDESTSADRIIDALESVQWYHYGPLEMNKGGSTTDEGFTPYVLWSDIEKIINNYYNGKFDV